MEFVAPIVIILVVGGVVALAVTSRRRASQGVPDRGDGEDTVARSTDMPVRPEEPMPGSRTRRRGQGKP
jgi:hypothetical protein